MHKKTKILYLVTLSEWGGAQKYIYDLATNSSPNFNIIVATGGDPHGQLITRLKENNIRTVHLPDLARSVNFYRDTRAFFSLIKLYKSEKPDIVHLNSSKAGALGALASNCCQRRQNV